LDRRALDDLVFQSRYSERPLPPIGLGDVHPTHRFRSVRSSLQSMGEILEVVLEGLAVVPPRLTVHARRRFLLQAEVSLAEPFRIVDMVEKRGEPQLLILLCCLTYPLQRAGRVFPARCPGRVLLRQVPFGQTSSLHPLRCRLPGIVRGLPRYSRSVRLPRSVRHRRASLDFPMRPRATAALGELGISRFPFEVLPSVHGVCDRAGLWHTSRYRCTGWGLPLSPTASASRSNCLTRLNTRPAHSLVNASTPPSRAAPHDSGPMWVATSHSYDSFIHYTSPVYPAHRRTNDAQPNIRCICFFELCIDVWLFDAAADAGARQLSAVHHGLNRSISDGPRCGDCDGPQRGSAIRCQGRHGYGPRKAWL